MDKDINQKLTEIDTKISSFKAELDKSVKFLENNIAAAVSHLDQQSINRQFTQEQVQNNLAQGILNLRNTVDLIIGDYSTIKADYLGIRQDYLIIRDIVFNSCVVKEDKVEEFEKVKSILIPKEEKK